MTFDPVRLLRRALLWGAAAFTAEVAYAYLWPAPAQPEFDPSVVLGPPDGVPLRVAALGDSTLTGPGVRSPDEIWARVALARLAEVTGRRVELRSVGVGGATSADVVHSQLEDAVRFSPRLALVSVGANDVIRGIPLKRLERNLDRIVEGLQAAGATVILSGVGDLGTIPRLAPPLRHMASRLGRRADHVHARVAERHGALKAEQWGWAAHQFRTRRDVWSPDRFHPNPAGHQIWAETCWDVLAPLCKTLSEEAHRYDPQR